MQRPIVVGIEAQGEETIKDVTRNEFASLVGGGGTSYTETKTGVMISSVNHYGHAHLSELTLRLRLSVKKFGGD